MSSSALLRLRHIPSAQADIMNTRTTIRFFPMLLQQRQQLLRYNKSISQRPFSIFRQPTEVQNGGSSATTLLLRGRQKRHHHAVAAIISTTPCSKLTLKSTTTTPTITGSQQDASHYYQRWWQVAGGVAAAGMGLGMMNCMGPTTASRCEQPPPPQQQQHVHDSKQEATADPTTTTRNDKDEDSSNNSKNDYYTIGPDDPYYTVPEEDEPTDCSMCLTFRQGPCRLDWKRFELCAKDNKGPIEKEEEATATANNNDGDSGSDKSPDTTTANQEGSMVCMKYALPFYYCSSKHANSYLIVGNEQTQELVITPLMNEFSSLDAMQNQGQQRRLCWARSPQIDWTTWETFVQALADVGGAIPTRFSLDQTGFQTPAQALKATWDDPKGNQYLMMNEEGEPFLITVTAEIPTRQPAAAHSETTDTTTTTTTPTLMIAFALDQDGNLIGDAPYKEEEEGEQKDDDNNNSNTISDSSATATAAQGNNKDPSSSSSSSSSSETATVLLRIQLIPGVTKTFTIYGLYVPQDGDHLDDGILYESKPYSLPNNNKATKKKAKKKKKEH